MRRIAQVKSWARCSTLTCSGQERAERAEALSQSTQA